MKISLAAALAGCCLLPGCYEFDSPLDLKPRVKVDEKLPGPWRCFGTEDSADEAPFILNVEKRNDTTTAWMVESVSGDGSKETSGYEAFGSTVSPGHLLNLRETGEKASGMWTFVRYSFLLPHLMRVELIEDKPFEKVQKNQIALRSAIEKRLNDPTIFTEFCLCVRAKKKATSP